MRRIYFLFILVLFFSACKKSEIEQIPFNESPPDGTITTVVIENYITRTYILSLGREPDSLEFNTAKIALSSALLDSTSRQVFLDSVFRDSDFPPHVYAQNLYDLLNNTDTAEFTNWIYLFQLFLQDTTYQSQWPYLQYENDRMIEMQSAFFDFTNKNIEVNELQYRMINNYLYDQINMGTLNFVNSTFQKLLNRNPTLAEQQSSVSMVDGNNAILFLQSGASKEDYLNIIIHSSNYYEGQVVFMYLKYLNRTPSTLEMADGTLKYITTDDYTAVQRNILSSDEFIGL